MPNLTDDEIWEYVKQQIKDPGIKLYYEEASELLDRLENEERPFEYAVKTLKMWVQSNFPEKIEPIEAMLKCIAVYHDRKGEYHD